MIVLDLLGKITRQRWKDGNEKMKDFYRLFNAVSALLLYYDNLKDFEVAYRYISEDIRDTYNLQLINDSEYRRLKQQMYVIRTGITELREAGLGPSKLNEIFTAEHWDYDNLKDIEVAYRYISEDIRDTYNLQLSTGMR